MVRLLIGRAGSGKTWRMRQGVLAALRDGPLGPPIFWITPRQATFVAERELTAASGGYCRARVVSFDDLTRLILAEDGGHETPQVTELGRQMIIGHLLRQNESSLQFYSSVARHTGLARQLEATFDELERCGHGLEQLDALLNDLTDADPADVEGRALVNKVADLRLIYGAYIEHLGRERLDPHRRLMQVVETIEESRLLRGARLCVDDFFAFTSPQLRLLSAAARVCERIEIALTLDPDHPAIGDPHRLPDALDPFFRTAEAYRRVHFAMTEAKVEIAPPLKLAGSRRLAGSAALSRLEREFDGSGPRGEASAAQVEPGEAIQLLEAPDRRGEVEQAARCIRRLTASGVRWRQIVVLARNLDDYAPFIDSVFRSHNIAAFVDQRRTAEHHPLLELTRSALRLVRGDWPHESMMALLKTGMAALNAGESDELENYVLKHRIHGSRWADVRPWNWRRLAMLENDEAAVDPGPEHVGLRRIDAIRRRVIDALSPLVAALGPSACDGEADGGPVRLAVHAFVAELYGLFERLGTRKTLTAWMRRAVADGDLEQRGEHEQVWVQLMDLLDQLLDVFPSESMTLDEFIDVLESGLERFDLALVPPSLDQVLIGQADRTRVPDDVRVTIVLGLSEGQFPSIGRENTILGDDDRRCMRQHQLDIEPDAQRRLLDEHFLGYLAFTRASEKLILTRAITDAKGRPTVPSTLWQRLVELWPAAAPLPLDAASLPPAETIETLGQLVRCLMQWARRRGADTGLPTSQATGPWDQLYQWISGPGRELPIVQTAWPAMRYANLAELLPDIIRELFDKPLRATAERLETFVACPFQHFARHTLALRGREESTISSLDLSGIYHRILAALLRRSMREGIPLDQLDAQRAAAWVDELVKEIGGAVRGEVMLTDARNRYLLGRIKRNVEMVITTQVAAARRGTFRPAAIGAHFGEEDSDLPGLRVQTQSGKQVVLEGHIDRIDVTPDRGGLTVLDYRMGDRKLALADVYHGLSLGLLTSLLAAASGASRLLGAPSEPAGTFFVPLKRPLADEKHPDKAIRPDDPRFDLQDKPRGIFDGKYFSSLDAQIAPGVFSDVVQARINRDGSLGSLHNSQAAKTGDFQTILRFTASKLAEVAQRLMDGDIRVHPYRRGNVSPCSTCAFRTVCRFEPAINGYRFIEPVNAEDALSAMAAELST